MSYDNKGYRGSGYKETRGEYRNNGYKQREERHDAENKLGAKFRIRGILCKTRAGTPYDEIKTKNGAAMCVISLMLSSYRSNSSNDGERRGGASEERSYYKIVAFREVAEQIMKDAVVHATVDVTGNISFAPEYQGRREIQFIAEKMTIVHLPKPKSDSDERQSREYQRETRPQNRERSYSYEERPDNRSYRREERPAPPPPPENYNDRRDEGDYANTESDNDVPF